MRKKDNRPRRLSGDGEDEENPSPRPAKDEAKPRRRPRTRILRGVPGDEALRVIIAGSSLPSTVHSNHLVLLFIIIACVIVKIQ